jgi:hypothetical protein
LAYAVQNAQTTFILNIRIFLSYPSEHPIFFKK